MFFFDIQTNPPHRWNETRTDGSILYCRTACYCGDNVDHRCKNAVTT